MSNITTRTGDGGSTDVKDYRVKKDSGIMELIGDLDEAQAHLIYAYTLNEKEAADFKGIVEDIVLISAIITGYHVIDSFPQTKITELEISIEERGQLIFDWVYPFDSPFRAQCNIARTVIRRAERSAYKELNESEYNIIKVYLNRLSDLLFTYTSEVEWR